MPCRFALVALVLCGACATPRSAKPEKHTLPEPLVAAKLPDRPDVTAIPPPADWAVAVEGYVVTDKDGAQQTVMRPGVAMSMEKGARAARYVVSYNELRGLYVVDLRTWGRERTIYERHLDAADKEIEVQRKRAVRTWFEEHDGTLGIVVGIIVGVAASAAGAKALSAAAK